MNRMYNSRFPIMALAVVLLAQAGCLLIPDDKERGEQVANLRPTVRITGGAATPDPAGIDYKVQFYWSGSDADGVIDLYQWAVDDTVSERAWRDTTGFSARFNFSATRLRVQPDSSFTDWHTFYIRAIDNEFSVSKPDKRYFNARTIAPTSRIVFPAAATELTLQLQRTTVVTWEGEDIDSSRPDKKPVAYEYKLVRLPGLPLPEHNYVDSLLNGQNLLDSLGIGAKSKWIRVSLRTTSITLRDLPASQSFAFGVRAVDEAGAIEPELKLGRNYLAFVVSSSISQPEVFISELSLGTHRFPNEGAVWELSVPPGAPLRFNWVGDASFYGSRPGNVNYALDIPDPENESLRDPKGIGGWVGWGKWKSNQVPFKFSLEDGGTTHYLYVLMRDISDNRSSTQRCVIKLNVVAFTFFKSALVVDDARFQGVPTDGPHDAFLNSTILRRLRGLDQVADIAIWPGIGEGGTDSPRILRLEEVADYRTVVWHVNIGSSVYSGIGDRLGKNVSILSTFLKAGGQLFMFGGQISGIELRDLNYPKDPPLTEIEKNRLYYKFLYMQNEVVGYKDPAGGTCYAARSGLVMARSQNPAYPDIYLDTAKWDPWIVLNQGKPNAEYKGGIMTWEGCMRGLNQVPAQHEGLDTLYTAGLWNRSFRQGCGLFSSTSEGAVIGARYESTRGDTLLGLQHGRVVYFDFQPWYFQGDRLMDAGTSAVNWLLTGRD
jgi:hypothetical protein